MSRSPQGIGSRLIGVISDTHGQLRPEALKAFQDTDLIIHAGDIGKPEVLETLRLVAPVYAVRGNMDAGAWAVELPETEVVEIGEVLLYVLHDANRLDLDPAAAGFSCVISGHTHRPLIDNRKGVLFLNPGTAGPHSFKGTVALLHLRGSSLEAHVVEL
ncbi:MAG: metallophosphoesterase family protein [Deltaproteobacteria bacterium]|nr:MAG: metallophosphoesterase family protein [Deltaproteobacteria bacterium]